MTDTTTAPAFEASRAQEDPGYVVNAPYYDLIFPSVVRDTLAGALRAVLPGARAVAELGPGTGQFTEVIARLLGSEAEVFAVEPARIMRAALATRLAALPGDAARVTVLPEGALEAELDTPCDAVVLFNLVMHFGPRERAKLWRKWGEALRPGGLLLLETQYPQTAVAVPASEVPGRTLGRRRYDTVSRAEVAGEDLIRWIMTYRTWEGEELLLSETAEFDCHVVSDERLAAELTGAGFTRQEDPAEGVQAWRRS
ncbi:class I SAM-dependent methyltransferase [Actinocorallia populi]|uniref:class I SAM-dependent methyltransferase n=1 Tax=Actinocorallia populi TaxID=2079200 RepID=UPI000D0901DD|nr:class I SAM-dependent methyltransferase [Actinocorallia populi]